MTNCSWCGKPSTVWLMGQPFCPKHANQFREAHSKVTQQADEEELEIMKRIAEEEQQ